MEPVIILCKNVRFARNLRSFWKPLLKDFAEIEKRVLSGTAYEACSNTFANCGTDWVQAADALIEVYAESGNFGSDKWLLFRMLEVDWLVGALRKLSGEEVCLLLLWLSADSEEDAVNNVNRFSLEIENGCSALIITWLDRIREGYESMKLDDSKSALWSVSGVASSEISQIRNLVGSMASYDDWTAIIEIYEYALKVINDRI